MLEEALKKKKEEISEALDDIGYELSGSLLVNSDQDGKYFITLSIRPKEE